MVVVVVFVFCCLSLLMVKVVGIVGGGAAVAIERCMHLHARWLVPVLLILCWLLTFVAWCSYRLSGLMVLLLYCFFSLAC